ncbi:MAG TPA: ketoacyl-ACP synthase III [Steroidobacteraceae bacterium]|nr:ketoacyl-ACP synthase III [Steroidobacteraceae bacterium]
MTHAAIIGWGKCLPPSVLTNQDLATFLPTDDAWITSRTGMKERRISHVPGIELAIIAARHAIACAGLRGEDIELVIYGSCSNDETVPNSASGVQQRIGAMRAAAFDINTACTSFMYGLSIGTSMIKSGVVKNALVIGVELISQYLDWDNRNVAVLFGDGAAAVVLQASEQESGVIAEKLQCYADSRHILRVRGMGTMYANLGVQYGQTTWDFDGQEIFRKAVQGMGEASVEVMQRAGVTMDDIALVVPHQANLRIIEAVAKRAGAGPDKLYLTIQKYGNMSAATAPVALVEAVEEGRVPPGGLVLMPAFGGGLTLSSHLIRWGQRVTPLQSCEAALAPSTKTALELVNEIRAQRKLGRAETSRFATLDFAENRSG